MLSGTLSAYNNNFRKGNNVMKKLLSIFTAIAIFLTASVVPVSAAKTKGSITITNATVGETYEVYKIFDADVLLDANDNATAVTYSLEKTDENAVLFEALFGADGKAKNDNPVIMIWGKLVKRSILKFN